MTKGIIALDIDGTITIHAHRVDPPVVSCLDELYFEGFAFVFLTGRSFAYAHSLLKTFTFPYLLATENGATLFAMPERKLFKKHYIPKKEMVEIAHLFEKHNLEPLIYSGYEKGDFCYFRPGQFSTNERVYLKQLENLTPSGWIEVDQFDQIDQDEFPLMKGVGTKEQLEPIFQVLKLKKTLHVKLIEDPFRKKTHCYLLITHALANKGHILKEFKILLEKNNGKTLVAIAAGDDFNDFDMLKNADFAIAFENSPKELKEIAHFIAKPASEHGIIESLNQAKLIAK